jgi:acyl dehydratase
MTAFDPKPGDALAPLQRTITLTDMVAYAGATWDWHKLHYDLDYVRSKRLQAPIVDGQVFGALLIEQLQDWAGPDSFVQRLDFAFKALVFAGDSIRCEGTVTAVTDGAVAVEQRVVVVNGEGRELRVAVAPATARLLLGRADGPGGPATQGGGA